MKHVNHKKQEGAGAGEAMTAWMRGMAGLEDAARVFRAGDKVRLYAVNGGMVEAEVLEPLQKGLVRISVIRSVGASTLPLGETVGEFRKFGFKISGGRNSERGVGFDEIHESAFRDDADPEKMIAHNFYEPAAPSWGENQDGERPEEESLAHETPLENVIELEGHLRETPLENDPSAYAALAWGAETMGLEMRPLSDISEAALAKGGKITLWKGPAFGLELVSLRADGSRFRIRELFATHHYDIGDANVAFAGGRAIVTNLKSSRAGGYHNPNGTLTEKWSKDLKSFEYRANGYMRILPARKGSPSSVISDTRNAALRVLEEK